MIPFKLSSRIGKTLLYEGNGNNGESLKRAGANPQG